MAIVAIAMIGSSVAAETVQAPSEPQSVSKETDDLHSARLRWPKLQRAIIQSLNRHRVPSDSDPDATSLKLGPNSYLVSDVNLGMFIASGTDGKYSIVWRDDEIKDSLICPDQIPGPFLGGLPDTSDGDIRFFVASTGCWPAGYAHTYWLTIFRLHGRTVTDELHGTYEFNSNLEGKDNEPSLKGNVLHVLDLHQNKSFWEGGGGPMYDWIIYIGPDGVKDLGRVPKDAERHFVDDLFTRLFHARPASDLAAARVISRLRSSIGDLPKPTNDKNHSGGLGEMVEWSVERNDLRSTACLLVDPKDTSGDHTRKFVFTLIKRSKHLYVSDVKVSPSTGYLLSSNPRPPMCSS